MCDAVAYIHVCAYTSEPAVGAPAPSSSGHVSLSRLLDGYSEARRSEQAHALQLSCLRHAY